MLAFLAFLFADEIKALLSTPLKSLLAILLSIIQKRSHLCYYAARKVISVLTSHPPHLQPFFRNSTRVLKQIVIVVIWQPPRLQPLLRNSWLRWLRWYTDPTSRYETEMILYHETRQVRFAGEPQTQEERDLRHTDPILAALSLLPSAQDVDGMCTIFADFKSALAESVFVEHVKKESERCVESATREASAVGRTFCTPCWGATVSGGGGGSRERSHYRVYCQQRARQAPPAKIEKDPRKNYAGSFRSSSSPLLVHDDGGASNSDLSDLSSNFTDVHSDDSGDLDSVFDSRHSGSTSFSPSNISTAIHSQNSLSKSQHHRNLLFPGPHRRNSFGRVCKYTTLNAPILHTNALKAKYASERSRKPTGFQETYLQTRYRMRVGRKVKRLW